MVDIGSSENHPEVIHEKDSETGETTIKVVDNKNPKSPVVYDVVTYPKVPSSEAALTPTNKPVPEDSDIESSW